MVGSKTPVGGRHRVVVLAEGGSDVDEAGAVLGGDEIADEDREAARLAVGEIEDRALVGDRADQLRALEFRQHLGLLAEHPLDQRLGDDQNLVAELRPHVGDVGADRDRAVPRQCPGRRRPDQQPVALLERPGRRGEREADVDRGVLDVLVAERDLVRGERGAVARAVGDDLWPS